MSGDKTRAKNACLDFLTLWKDADPDIPILRQAQAEYARRSERGMTRSVHYDEKKRSCLHGVATVTARAGEDD